MPSITQIYYAGLTCIAARYGGMHGLPLSYLYEPYVTSQEASRALGRRLAVHLEARYA